MFSSLLISLKTQKEEIGGETDAIVGDLFACSVLSRTFPTLHNTSPSRQWGQNQKWQNLMPRGSIHLSGLQSKHLCSLFECIHSCIVEYHRILLSVTLLRWGRITGFVTIEHVSSWWGTGRKALMHDLLSEWELEWLTSNLTMVTTPLDTSRLTGGLSVPTPKDVTEITRTNRSILLLNAL